MDKPPLRCDECGLLCDDWTAFDGGVVIVCAPCLVDGPPCSCEYEMGVGPLEWRDPDCPQHADKSDGGRA